MWAEALVIGALGGAAADWIAARGAGTQATRRSMLITALIGAAVTALIVTHGARGWHAWLLPLWLWGWILAADADLRTQELYDADTFGLLALALIAGLADHIILVALAGAVAMAAIWLIVRGGLRWWTWRASVILAGVGAVVAIVARYHLTVVQAQLAPPTRAIVYGTMAHAWTAAMIWMVVGAAVVALAPVLGWMGTISRRAHGPDEQVGGADVLLWAAIGAWFGLRWVWPVAGAAVIALALVAGAQVLARKRGWHLPWAPEGLPIAPVLFVLLVFAS